MDPILVIVCLLIILIHLTEQWLSWQVLKLIWFSARQTHKKIVCTYLILCCLNFSLVICQHFKIPKRFSVLFFNYFLFLKNRCWTCLIVCLSFFQECRSPRKIKWNLIFITWSKFHDLCFNWQIFHNRSVSCVSQMWCHVLATLMMCELSDLRTIVGSNLCVSIWSSFDETHNSVIGWLIVSFRGRIRVWMSDPHVLG